MEGKDFGRFLKEERKAKNYTLKELGDLIGLTHSYLSLIENGHKGFPQRQTVQKIAHGLGYTYFDLMKKAGIEEKESVDDLLIESKDLAYRINELKKEIERLNNIVHGLENGSTPHIPYDVLTNRDKYQKFLIQYNSLDSKIKKQINNLQTRHYDSLIDTSKSVPKNFTQEVTINLPKYEIDKSYGLEIVGSISKEEAARRLFDLKDLLELNVDLYYDGKNLSEGERKQIKAMLRVLLNKEE